MAQDSGQLTPEQQRARDYFKPGGQVEKDNPGIRQRLHDEINRRAQEEIRRGEADFHTQRAAAPARSQLSRLLTRDCRSMSASRGYRRPRAKGRLTRRDDGQGDGIAAHTATRGLFAGTRVRHVAVRSVGMRAAFRLGPQ